MSAPRVSDFSSRKSPCVKRTNKKDCGTELGTKEDVFYFWGWYTLAGREDHPSWKVEKNGWSRPSTYFSVKVAAMGRIIFFGQLQKLRKLLRTETLAKISWWVGGWLGGRAFPE